VEKKMGYCHLTQHNLQNYAKTRQGWNIASHNHNNSPPFYNVTPLPDTNGVTRHEEQSTRKQMFCD
jgi:hypothetical protein